MFHKAFFSNCRPHFTRRVGHRSPTVMVLSAGELLASQKRLESRTKEHSEKLRQKAEKERILQERARQRQAAIEEQQAARRLAQLAAEEQARREREEELERNNGVFYRAELLAVPVPETLAAEKGIRRAADKVLLPPSAGASLMDQNAYKNGPMFFKLTSPGGTTTHAGVLEFSAAEGFVALPREVIRSLWGPNATEEVCDGKLKVSYTRLPKGMRAVFQPRSARFQEAVGESMREVLEQALHTHSCLSEGDWVEVQHGGEAWDLRVRELSPEAQVSVIDTDLEAEINPSIETEERIRAEEDRARQYMEAAAAAALEQARLLQEEEEKAAEQRLHGERLRQMKEAALPPEPPADAGEPLLACMLRFPDGSRHSRRFLLSDSLQVVLDFADSKGASGLPSGGFLLVTQYPRRVFGAQQAGQALGQLGLQGPREVLFLEPAKHEQQ